MLLLVLLALVALMVLLRLPWLVLALAVWFVLSRRCGAMGRRWARHGGHPGG